MANHDSLPNWDEEDRDTFERQRAFERERSNFLSWLQDEENQIENILSAPLGALGDAAAAAAEVDTLPGADAEGDDE